MTQAEIEQAVESMRKPTDASISVSRRLIGVSTGVLGHGTGNRSPLHSDAGGRESVYQPVGPATRGLGEAKG